MASLTRTAIANPVRITAPSAYPVSLSEVKQYMRITHDADDAMITLLLTAAIQQCEEITQRSLMEQTWQVTLDEFSDAIQLLRPPVQSILGVTYVDADGATQAMDVGDFYLDVQGYGPAWLVPSVEAEWPTPRDQANAVVVTYVAGYGYASESVPAPIKMWIMIRVADFYENRGKTVIGQTVESVPWVDGLLDTYRIHSLG